MATKETLKSMPIQYANMLCTVFRSRPPYADYMQNVIL